MTIIIAASGNMNMLQTLVVQFSALRFVYAVLILPKVPLTYFCQ